MRILLALSATPIERSKTLESSGTRGVRRCAGALDDCGSGLDSVDESDDLTDDDVADRAGVVASGDISMPNPSDSMMTQLPRRIAAQAIFVAAAAGVAFGAS